jgi:hypothetical protein
MMAETFQGNTAWEFPFATRLYFRQPARLGGRGGF